MALCNEAARRAETRLDEAEALLRRAPALAEQRLGERHAATATCVNNLADTLRLARRYDEAEPVARRAVALYESVHGPESEPTATALSNLALVLRNQGNLAGAEPLYRRALAILEKAHGPDDVRIAGVVNTPASSRRRCRRRIEPSDFRWSGPPPRERGKLTDEFGISFAPRKFRA